MKVMKFKCDLLSDIILNQKFSTEGANQTLDFIPGNNFLGIVAGKLYNKLENKDTWTIFHSGKVRFSDAHPANGNHRTIRIPASLFIPKLLQKGNDEDKEYYIHHLIPDLESETLLKKQLKQCRKGFYDFLLEEAIEIKVNTAFAIKSAYDRVKRRSKDEEMFGYQCISKGLTYYFSVEVDENSLGDIIKDVLCGIQRIGRSRSAQYGLVEIAEADFEEPVSSKIQTNELVIYADGRLIFLDEYGMPTYQPTTCQLGLPQGEILWEKSQIRTFHYSPYNYKRKCFDTDRCGIEKGSVIIVKLDECIEVDSLSTYIGSYQNEGFGKVIYNPIFLNGKEDGKVLYRPCSNNKNQEKEAEFEKPALEGSNVLVYIDRKRKESKILLEDSYVVVNKWVKENVYLFRDKDFASQWGQIRNIAMMNSSKDIIEEKINDYLEHGIAKEKWTEHRRKKILMDFIKKLTDDNAQIVMVNLAAEMAKKCKKGGQK